MHFWLVSALALTAGCKNVDPAPADLDGLMHQLWGDYEGASDEELTAAVVELHDVIDADSMEELEDGSLTALAADAADGLPISPAPDPSLAQGLYILNVIDCDLSQLERILYDLDQDRLYEGAYETYDRTYLSDFDAYVAREAPTLEWEIDLTAELVGAEFDEALRGGLRYWDDPENPLGPALMARTFLTEPATFPEGSSKSFDQDYQLEVYYERAPGEVVHAYAIWRVFDMGGGLTIEDESVMRIILNNLADWDDNTAQLCADGAP